MADLHHLVIDDIRQRIDGVSIRLEQNEVVDRRQIEGRRPVNSVVEGDLAPERSLEADDGASALRLSFCLGCSAACLVAAAAVVSRRLPVARLLRPQRFEARGRTPALVSVALREQAGGGSCVVLEPLGLDVGPV